MRSVFGIIFGIVGAIASFFFFVNTGDAETIDVVSVLGYGAIGFVVGFPAGYMLGSIPGLPGNAPRTLLIPHKEESLFSPQIVGSPCVACGQNIILVSDGRLCQECDSIYHAACAVDDQCPSCAPRS